MLISSSSRYSIYKVQWSVLVSLSLTRTSLFYHSHFDLSRTFFKFFQIFSTAFEFQPPSRTASIYYHTPNYLSTPKTNFFGIVFKRGFTIIDSWSAAVRWTVAGAKKPRPFGQGLCWRYLSSRAVARQVLSAQMSLTSVFGMGTGGPSSQSTPTV